MSAAGCCAGWNRGTSRDPRPVILVAGRNDIALSWGPVLAALAGRVRAVAYDRAGLGDSDPDPQIPSAERAVADLSTLISLVNAGPCVVAGHSWVACSPSCWPSPIRTRSRAWCSSIPPFPACSAGCPARYGTCTAPLPALPMGIYATGLLRPLSRRAAARAARAFSDDPNVRDLVIRAYLTFLDWPGPAVRGPGPAPPPPRNRHRHRQHRQRRHRQRGHRQRGHRQRAARSSPGYRPGVGGAGACHYRYHVKHKADGGQTSVRDCVLLCWFHHQVVIHRWGWTLVLNPDGTTTAWNPGKTRILHSHSPPAEAG